MQAFWNGLIDKDDTGVVVPLLSDDDTGSIRFLLTALNVGNKNCKNWRKELDNISSIKYYFKKINFFCRNNYSVDEYDTIDKMLERCSFQE